MDDADPVARRLRELETTNANWAAMHQRALDEIRAAAGLTSSATVPEIVRAIEALRQAR